MPPIALGATGSRSIYSLPDDVLLLIISYISVKDIITLRKVCHHNSSYIALT